MFARSNRRDVLKDGPLTSDSKVPATDDRDHIQQLQDHESKSNRNDLVGRDVSLHGFSCDESIISGLTLGQTILGCDRTSRTSSWTGSRLHGRDNEIALFDEAYQRICHTDHGASEVFFVHGSIGTGKTSLVDHLRNPTRHGDEEPYFVYGRYDLDTSQEPFTAIVNAFSDICDFILQSDELEEMKDAINEVMGNQDSHMMTLLITSLSMILSDGNTNATPTNLEGDMPTSPQNLTRFRWMCRAFLRAVATEKHPIILFLDNVHLANTDSVDIIAALLTDARSKHLLIILGFRDDEINIHTPLQAILQLQRNTPPTVEHLLATTDIPLENLPFYAVNLIVSDMMKLSPETTMSLSEVVHHKTLGNPHFVVQFLEILAWQRLLTFSSKESTWEWDLDSIQSETMVCDNVGDLVASKIRRLSLQVQETLMVASCLGYSFDVTLLRAILLGLRHNQEFCEQENSRTILENLDDILETATKEGVIEKGSNIHRYKFAHEKLQSRLYDMIPKEKERELLHLDIGKSVMETCTTDTDTLHLVAANQMNLGRSHAVDKGEMHALATLNLKAARIAKFRCAYMQASQYLSIASEVLGAKKWDTYYDLSLEIVSSRAEMEYCSANFLTCWELVNEVLVFSRSSRDRLRGYYAMIESLRAEDRLNDAMELGYKVLAEFNVTFPKRPSLINIAVSLKMASSMLPRTLDDILKLPEMKDEDHLACMKIMGILAHCAYFLERSKEFTLLSLRMMRFTLNFGVSDMSTQALATFGMIKVFMGKYDDGFTFGRLSIRLLERIYSREAEARSLTIVFCFTNHWRMPMKSMVAPLLRAYTSGLATSEIGFGLIAAYNRIVALASLGTPLDQVDNEIRSVQEQCYEFKQAAVLRLLAPTHQAILNFQGESNFPLILTGAVMEQTSFTEEAQAAKNHILLHGIAFNRLKLSLHFQEWCIVDELLPLIEKYRKKNRGIDKHFSVLDFQVVAGIAYAVLWQRTGKRKNLHKFQRVLKHSEVAWLSSGLEQCKANYSFLLAEQKVFQKAGLSVILQAYTKAINDLEHAQLIHFQAFANERAGTVLLQSKGENEMIVAYFSEAQSLYARYGAHAKVNQLEKKIESVKRLIPT